jgi:hypothetical protein
MPFVNSAGVDLSPFTALTSLEIRGTEHRTPGARSIPIHECSSPTFCKAALTLYRVRYMDAALP